MMLIGAGSSMMSRVLEQRRRRGRSLLPANASLRCQHGPWRPSQCKANTKIWHCTTGRPDAAAHLATSRGFRNSAARSGVAAPVEAENSCTASKCCTAKNRPKQRRTQISRGSSPPCARACRCTCRLSRCLHAALGRSAARGRRHMSGRIVYIGEQAQMGGRALRDPLRYPLRYPLRDLLQRRSALTDLASATL